MKKTSLTILLLTVTLLAASANKTFDTTKKYKIVCKQYGTGAVVVGSNYGYISPLYYHISSNDTIQNIYWILEESGVGQYAIKNAVTKQYITFDGSRINNANLIKRGIDLTDEVASNNQSLWFFQKQDDYCAIINVAQTTQSFNVRGGPSLVGTYDGTITDNGLFQLYDEEGKLWGEEPKEIGIGFENFLSEISIDGNPLIYDNRYQQYMALAPTNAIEKGNHKAQFTFTPKEDGKQYTLLVSETTSIQSGDSCLITELQGGKNYKLDLLENGVSISQTAFTFTTLPLVEITGSFGSSYTQGAIRINEYGVTPELLNAQLRHRGATASGKAKKAYAVKLYDENWESIDKSYFGLRSDNNWILDAMAIDPGRTRNRVSTDIWNAFSTAPYHIVDEPKLINGTRGQYVEVILNGSYHGIYCMTEKVDRKQLKLKKFQEETRNPRGLLYKSSQWSYEVFMGHEIGNPFYPLREARSYNNNSDTWASFEMQYPEVEDGEPIDWAPLRDAVNVVAASNENQFMEKVADYFDLPVFLDYYLFLELLLATDNHGKNMFLYNYNKDKHKMISVAPWDLDGVFGRRWDGSSFLTGNPKQDYDQFITNYEHGQYTLFKRLKEYDYESFNDSLAHRYAKLRLTHFSDEELLARFTNYIKAFNQSGASARELERWNGTDSRITNLDNELDFTNRWIAERLTFLDEKYDIENLNIVNDVTEKRTNSIFSAYSENGVLVIESGKPTLVRIYTISGQLLQNYQTQTGMNYIHALPKGLYLVNGQKVIIR